MKLTVKIPIQDLCKGLKQNGRYHPRNTDCCGPSTISQLTADCTAASTFTHDCRVPFRLRELCQDFLRVEMKLQLYLFFETSSTYEVCIAAHQTDHAPTGIYLRNNKSKV